MKKSCYRLALLLLASVVGNAGAQSNAAKILAPHIDESTFLVGEIDVQNIAIDELFARAQKLEIPKQHLAAGRVIATKMRDDFLNAGGRKIYFALNLVDMETGPLWIVPIEAGANKETLARLFAQIPDSKTSLQDNELLVGHANVLANDKKRQRKDAPDFAVAFGELADSPTRVAVVLPQTVRRAQQELVPNLPKELGGESLTALLQAFRFAGLGLDLGAKSRAQLLIQGKDEMAAKQMQQFLKETGEKIKQMEKNEQTQQILAKLLPIVNSNRLTKSQLTWSLDPATLDDAVLPLLGRARRQAALTQSINNLKQIGLAMHHYHDINKTFPPQYTVGKDKKPLLSWRVHILPWLDEDKLYKEFHLDEPWDSEHNKKLVAKMPFTYRSPLMGADVEAGKTTYVLPVGPKLIFDGGKKMKIQQITDGTSNTILAIDAPDSRAVYWTKPDDYRVDPKQPKSGAVRPGIGILSVFCDGAVRVLPSKTSDEMLWRFFCPNDGQPVNFYE